MNRALVTVIVSLATASTPALLCAQSPNAALPPLLPRAHEVALARSAAPAEVSAAATVLVLERGGFVEAERGTNGVTCLVDRSHPEAIEPHCFDEEASRTIVPIRKAETRLREQGRSKEEIAAAIRDGIRSGRFELPSRAAMTYMMSSAQVLYNEEGRRVGAWKPHLMIYMPYVKPADFGLSGSGSDGAAVVADAGEPLASVVIVVPSFVDPRPAQSGGR